MATIAINYRELRNAANDAKHVAQKLDTYANAINNTVLRKLDNYSGDRTGNISSAISNARNKKNQLEGDSKLYNDYSNNLSNLQENCKNTDKRVARRVEGLTATFKDRHNIKTNAVVDAINRFLTKITNSSPVLRWIDNNIIDRDKEIRGYLKDKIKEWYHYGGGKQWLKGTGKALAEIALAVTGIVLAVIGTATGVTEIIMAVVAVIGGTIALVNGIANLVNEQFAYASRQNGNASYGYRLSKLDTYTDTLRTFSDDKRVHTFANIVDGVEFVCDVINFVHDVGDALKNVKTIFKNGKTILTHVKDWARNGITNIKSRGFLTVSRELFQNMHTKVRNIGGNIRSGFGNMRTAWRNRNFDFFKVPIRNFFTDFKNSLQGNFTEQFLDFSSAEKGWKSVENIIKFGDKLVDVDSIKDFAGLVADEFILPNIEVDFIKNKSLRYDETTKLLVIDQHGKLTWDEESMSLKDIKDKFNQAFEFGKDIFSMENIGQFIWDKIKDVDIVSSGIEMKSGLKDLIGKFTKLHDIDITIPKSYIPPVNIQININIQPIYVFTQRLVA